MPQINQVAPTPPSSGTTATNPAGVLDKEGFLRLLVGQLRQQDPMSAAGTEELMGQMTQLSMLEQVTNLTRANENLNQTVQTTQALSLLGKSVTFGREDGTTGEGTVDSIAFERGVATLTIGGETGILPAGVTGVR